MRLVALEKLIIKYIILFSFSLNADIIMLKQKTKKLDLQHLGTSSSPICRRRAPRRHIYYYTRGQLQSETDWTLKIYHSFCGASEKNKNCVQRVINTRGGSISIDHSLKKKKKVWLLSSAATIYANGQHLFFFIIVGFQSRQVVVITPIYGRNWYIHHFTLSFCLCYFRYSIYTAVLPDPIFLSRDTRPMRIRTIKVSS